MDSSDKNHEEAARIWRLCLDEEACIRTSNYVIIETTALLQSRLGMNAAALWNRDVLGVVEILWVDQPTHSIARDLWLGMGRTSVSLVDCVGFTLMRHHGMEKVFAFDTHLTEQGFELLPK